MKKQLFFAVKFLALTGAYLFTRSRTPADKLKVPENSIAVLFLLENLKRFVLYNADLVRGAKIQAEILENDVRLLRAFLGDAEKIQDKDGATEDLLERINQVVREGEDLIAAFGNQAGEIRDRSFFGRVFSGSAKVIGLAKEIKAVRAKAKKIYVEGGVLACIWKFRPATAEEQASLLL